MSQAKSKEWIKEVEDALLEWGEAERAMAIDTLPYLGLGPNEVIERRSKAVGNLLRLAFSIPERHPRGDLPGQDIQIRGV
jgi:hypothetical protein